MRMRDSEVVASILAGNPDGLAEAYDRYAAQLYTYCCTLLREPADAADAVQDTFVIASARLVGLRDPERLRSWLFAVARNECLRRLRDRTSTSAFDDAADLTDETVDVGGDAERAELRALLRAAMRGLNDSERDIIVLQLSQGLDAAEVAASMGVTRNTAHALLSRARSQLLSAVGVLLVGRTGRAECPALDEMLAGWDGHLTVLLRKRLNRHIERCPVCTARRQHELRPAMLLGLAGGPALLGAAAAVRHARQAGQVAAGLRDHVMGHAASAACSDPTALARNAVVLGKAGSYGPSGFPKSLNPPHVGLMMTSHARLAAVAGTGAAAVAAAAVIAVTTLPGGGPAAGHLAGGPSGQVAPGGGTASPASPPRGAAPSPRRSAGKASSGSPGAASPAPSPAPGSGLGFPGSPVPTTAASSAPATGRPTTSPPSTATSPPTTTPPPPSPPAAGTISVSPGTVVLTPLLGSSFTITAHGGPVTWSVSAPASLLGGLSLSAWSGSLASGQSVTVSISTTLVSLDSQITVSPGGRQVTVLIGAL
jgi:RNA polymerase sigma factor (sigma-70 family)